MMSMDAPSSAGRWAALLASPRTGLLAVLIAVILNLPSLPTGWYLDDLVHRARFLELDPLFDSRDMTDRMYDFLSGDPEEISAYKDLGVLPWWADDHLRIRFWRPLSSFTHVIDYALWPDSGPAMHAHSLAWLAVLIALTAMLYRRFITVPLVAGLATLLYALDDAHGMPAAFLANRNAIVAASFGVLCLWLHDRFRREGWAPGAVLSPLAFLASLLAGESGIGIAPYLLGYALFLEPKRGVARFATIAPHALLGILWLILYRLGGYGSFGSGFYLDPLGEPLEWLSQFPLRASLLLLGQWFVPPSSFAFVWTRTETIAVAAFGALFLTVLFLFLRPILEDDPTARFFGFGMLLSVVPITAGFPHDRLLFFVGIGGMALLAMLLVRLFDRSLTSGIGRALAWSLVLAHVVLAPLLQLAMSSSVSDQEALYATGPRSLPDDPSLASQRLVVVNAPNAFYGQYTLLVRAFDSEPVPKTLLILAPGTTSLVLERPSSRTLTIEAQEGWLLSPFDIVYRSRSHPVPKDYQVTLSDVRIRVEALTEDGRPRNVRFEFDRDLDDHSLRWVRYENGRYIPFDLPAVGKSTTLDAIPFSLLTPPTPAD
jgi:hypothetical protein